MERGNALPRAALDGERGIIESEWREAESGHRRKYYRLRQQGRKALSAEKEQWMAVHKLTDKTMENPTPFDLNEAIRRWQKNSAIRPPSPTAISRNWPRTCALPSRLESERAFRRGVVSYRAPPLGRPIRNRTGIRQDQLRHRVVDTRRLDACRHRRASAHWVSCVHDVAGRVNTFHLWFPKLLHLAAGPVRAVTGLASKRF